MRWAGKVGYARQVEKKPGIWDDEITEVNAFGMLTEMNERLDSGDAVLPQYRVTTSIRIVTDGKRVPSAGMRYITKDGVRWSIATIVREHPAMVIYPGEEYHGALPAGAPATP